MLLLLVVVVVVAVVVVVVVLLLLLPHICFGRHCSCRERGSQRHEPRGWACALMLCRS